MEEIKRINQMLLSQDEELRNLGRIYLRALPKGTENLLKVALYLNSRNKVLVSEGVRLFLTEKRSIRVLNRLLEIFKDWGYSNVAGYELRRIEDVYKRVKKLTPLFEEVSIVGQFLKEKEAISIRGSDRWHSDWDGEKT